MDGNCESPPKKPNPDEGKRFVYGKNIRELFKKMEDLHDLPKDPKEDRRLYREQRGVGFWYPVCAGPCPSGKGKCKKTVEIVRDECLARCHCD